MRIRSLYGKEGCNFLQRIPNQKVDAVISAQARLRNTLTDDEEVNATALIRLLQEMADHG